MPTADLEVQDNPVQNAQAAPRRMAIALSSLFFSVLQSICTVAVAIHGLQLLLGVSSLLTAGVAGALEHFHQISWLRICLMIGALAGSLLTLSTALRARALRNRPASQWRQAAVTPGQRRMEGFQIALSVLTLVLVVLEEYFHFRFAHTL